MLIAAELQCLPLTVSSCHGYSSLHVRTQHDTFTMQESAMSLWSMPHAHAHAISISVLLMVHRHHPALFANSLARLGILPETIAISWLL